MRASLHWRRAARGRAARRSRAGAATDGRCRRSSAGSPAPRAGRCRPPCRARSAAAATRCGVKASAACATGSMASASRAGSAWPRTMRGASASAVARFSPGLTPMRQRRRVGGRDAVLVDQRDRPGACALRVCVDQRRRERFEREQRQLQCDPEHGGARESERASSSDVDEGRGGQGAVALAAARRATPRRTREHARKLEPQRRFERRAAPLQDAQLQGDRRRPRATTGAAATRSAAPRQPLRASRRQRRRGGAPPAGDDAAARRAGAAAARRRSHRRARSSAPARAPTGCRCRERLERVSGRPAIPRRQSRARRAPPPTAPPADRTA